jgi:hypothetical protein
MRELVWKPIVFNPPKFSAGIQFPPPDVYSCIVSHQDVITASWMHDRNPDAGLRTGCITRACGTSRLGRNAELNSSPISARTVEHCPPMSFVIGPVHILSGDYLVGSVWLGTAAGAFIIDNDAASPKRTLEFLIFWTTVGFPTTTIFRGVYFFIYFSQIYILLYKWSNKQICYKETLVRSDHPMMILLCILYVMLCVRVLFFLSLVL